MNKNELLLLADKYSQKADKAYRNYQDTGMTRYDTERRKNEDLADAMCMAAAAADEHHALIHLRGTMASLTAEAKRIEFIPEDQKPKYLEQLRKNLISAANLAGVYVR